MGRRTDGVGGKIPGIRLSGELIRRYWWNIDDMGESGKLVSGFMAACPDVGTMVCLSCELGFDRFLEVCDFGCRTCAGKRVCPCSRIGYERRQAEMKQPCEGVEPSQGGRRKEGSDG